MDKPAGQCLKEQLARNKRIPVRTSLQEVYAMESVHIADPLDYVGTKPDNEIRWRV